MFHFDLVVSSLYENRVNRLDNECREIIETVNGDGEDSIDALDIRIYNSLFTRLANKETADAEGLTIGKHLYAFRKKWDDLVLKYEKQDSCSFSHFDVFEVLEAVLKHKNIGEVGVRSLWSKLWAIPGYWSYRLYKVPEELLAAELSLYIPFFRLIAFVSNLYV